MKIDKIHKKINGFTVIELFIAVSILVIISSIVFSTFTQVIKSKKFLDDGRDSSIIANSILMRMSRELQLAYASSKTFLLENEENKSSNTNTSIALLGERKELSGKRRADSITFLAQEGGQFMPDGGGHSGLVQISYRLEQNPDDKSKNAPFYLVREELPYILPAKTAYERKILFPVANGIDSVSFSYYDIDKNEWVEEWGKTRRAKYLPAMISFTITVISELGRYETYSTTVAISSIQ